MSKKAMFFTKPVAGSTQLYSWSDAASPTGVTEGTSPYVYDGSIGWDDVSGTIVSQSVEVSPGGGSNAFELTSLGSTSFVYCYFVGTVGKNHAISFWVKAGTSTTASFRPNSGYATPSYQFPTGTWAEYTFNLTVTSSVCRFLFFITNGGSAGQTIYVDNFSIIET